MRRTLKESARDVMLIGTQPYQIRCAEIWGGTISRQDEVGTPGVRAAIQCSASGGNKGGDLYYFSVCAYDTLTRIAIADVRGHGSAASQLSEWLYGLLEARMNDADGARVLRDLNEIIRARGFSAITTAVIVTFHRDKGLLYYCYAGHPPLMLTRQGQTWHELPAPAGSSPANLPLGIVADARFTQDRIPAGRITSGGRRLCAPRTWKRDSHRYLVAVVPLVMGMNLPGWIHLPLDRLASLPVRTGGAFGMGFLLSLAIGPCGTPLLASVLSYAAYQGQTFYGALLLFLYGLGVGTPLLLAGTTACSLAQRLDGAGGKVG